jgi:hypothetical protein
MSSYTSLHTSQSSRAGLPQMARDLTMRIPSVIRRRETSVIRPTDRTRGRHQCDELKQVGSLTVKVEIRTSMPDACRSCRYSTNGRPDPMQVTSHKRSRTGARRKSSDEKTQDQTRENVDGHFWPALLWLVLAGSGGDHLKLLW